VDQYLNNRQNEILWKLLANPADNGHLYAQNLQLLVNDFPQSGLLHALLSHADSGQGRSHAAAYLNPKTLYVLVNSPESLATVTDAQIIQQLNHTTDNTNVAEAGSLQTEEEPQHNNFRDTIEAAPHFSAEPETVFNEINYAPLIPEVVNSGQNLTEVEPVTEEVPHVEQLQDKVTEKAEESTIEGHKIAEIPEEEKTGIEASVGNNLEEEPATEAPLVEQAKDTDTETAIASHVNEHGIAEAKNEEEIEPENLTENIRKDELVTETSSFALAEPPRGIDDDVYDEIVGIEDISFIQGAKSADEAIHPGEPSVTNEEELSNTATTELLAEPSVVQKDRVLNMDDEAEKLIVGNIAATDYFVFDRAFNDRKQAEPEPTESAPPVSEPHAMNGSVNVESAPAAENKDVSKYNDDTLPYTFMWWLNKTRREHAGIYQPFKLDTSQAIRQHGADELQQQYYENIFHLNSVEELDRSTPQQAVEFDLKSKEDIIIKRFIVEEPHIGTPSSDKLDTENKARKSSEDQDELVTETLARIYIDQMLYHKAINTYKKLMLKFPEKSRYFADQIEQLERKTN
jgi:hypothetical protein